MRRSLLRLYLPSKGLWIGIAIALAMAALQFGMVASFASSWNTRFVDYAIGGGSVCGWIAMVRVADWSVRFSELEAFLPVPARETSLAKALAIGCLLIAPVLASFAMVAGIGLANDVPVELLERAVSVTVGATGSIVLAVAIRSSVWPSHPVRRGVAMALLVGLVVGGFLLADPVIGAAAAGLGILVGASTYRTGPAAATLAIARSLEIRGDGARGRMSPLTRILVRRTLGSWRAVLGMTILVGYQIFGMVIGSARLSFGVTVAWVMITTEWNLQLVRVLAHLPISRQRLFRWLVAPPLCALVFGLAVGMFVASDERNGVVIQFEPREDTAGAVTYELRVPPDLWRIAIDEPPLVTAPTGETYRPTAYPLWSGSSYVRYNPYELGDRPDGELLAYQVSRALNDCCGAALSPAEARSRYLDGTRHRAIYAQQVDQQRRPVADHLLWLLVMVLSNLVVLVPILDRNRPPGERRVWRRLQVSRWLGPALVIAAWLVITWTLRSRVDVDGGVPFVAPLVTEVRSAFASHVVGATLAGVALAVGLLAVLQRRFLAMEPPPPPKRAPIPDAAFVDV